MPNQPNDEQRAALEAINARAVVDGDFRKKLLAEPREVIYQEFGIELPPSFRVRFIEKDPELDALFVLPDYLPEAAELSDMELEAVAGGWCMVTCNGVSSADVEICI
jgi:hypothetical protein